LGDLLLKGYSIQKTGAITENSTLNQGLGILEGRIAQEVADREKAIEDEKTARENAISTEATTREAADTVLTNNLNQEIKDRQAEDEALSGEISSVSNNLDLEIENREKAIAQEIADRNTAIDAKIKTLDADGINNIAKS
jgi:hypothetical protein